MVYPEVGRVHVKEAAVLSGASVKALKYYEAIGLVEPARQSNGYRQYSPQDVELVKQVKELTAMGLSVQGTRPFVECLRRGHVHGDDCPESLAAYHREIRRLTAVIAKLTSARQMLDARLQSAAARGFSDSSIKEDAMPITERYGLPENLPLPVDDGSAAHLVGLTIPALSLPASDGSIVKLDEASAGRWVIFIYPMTGVPGEDMPRGWDEIPGARGCTPEACGFRDNISDLLGAGLDVLYGVSTQGSRYQRELVERLHLPYLMLSDPTFALGGSLALPTFEAGGSRFYTRLTLVVRGRTIEHAFFPIFPTHEHAARVLEWLRNHP
jgi:peroxiredoxin/DNA-binding transcriptional MerR regulator